MASEVVCELPAQFRGKRGCGGFVGGDVVFFCEERSSQVLLFDLHTRSVVSWNFYRGRMESSASVAAWGRFLAAVFCVKKEMHVVLYDFVAGHEELCALYTMDEEEELSAVSVVSVLQASPGAHVWFLLGVGCKRGECVLVRQALSKGFADTNVGRVVDTHEFFAAGFLPPNSIGVATKLAVPTGDFNVTAFGFHEPMVAIGYESGHVLVRRLGTMRLSEVVDESHSNKAVKFLSFASGSRLIVGRDKSMQMMQLLVHNELLEKKGSVSRHLREEERLVWLSSSGGLVSYATLDELSGAVFLYSEPHLDLPFDFGQSQTLLSAAAGAPNQLLAFSLQLAPDRATSLKVAGKGVVVCTESVAPATSLLAQILRHGRSALEPPLSRSLGKKALEIGVAVARGDLNTDDDYAELLMEVCATKDCSGVLEDVLASEGVSARSAHLREWTKKFAARTLDECGALLQRHLDGSNNVAPDEKSLVELELALARLGSLYRLQESIARAATIGSEAQVLAARTLSHAQRLEVGIWLISSGLVFMQDFFPVSIIERTSRARRQALARSSNKQQQFLFCDVLWHLMLHGSGVPDGSSLWPPASFQQVLDAMVAVGDAPVSVYLKYTVLLFALMDASKMGDHKELVERCASRFSQTLAIPATVERRAKAFWMIDRNVDVEMASLELSGLGFPDWGNRFSKFAVNRLMECGNAMAAVSILRRVAAESVNTEDVETCLSAFIASGLIHEAFLLCRRVESVFTTFLILCEKEEVLHELIELPLNSSEETEFFSFVGLMATSRGKDRRDLLAVYLILRNRALEAQLLWNRVRDAVAAQKMDSIAVLDEIVRAAVSSQPECLRHPSEASSKLLCASMFLAPVASQRPLHPQKTHEPEPMDMREEEEGDLPVFKLAPEVEEILSGKKRQAAESFYDGPLSTPVKSLSTRKK